MTDLPRDLATPRDAPRDVDVAIVGGGLVGLSLAIACGSCGLDVVVVDREQPATIATSAVRSVIRPPSSTPSGNARTANAHEIGNQGADFCPFRVQTPAIESSPALRPDGIMTESRRREMRHIAPWVRSVLARFLMLRQRRLRPRGAAQR